MRTARMHATVYEDAASLATNWLDIRKTDNEYMLFYIGQIADGSL